MINNPLDEAKVAIDAGNKAEARRLLGSVLQDTPSAEAWLLAARAMQTDEQTVIALKKALEYDSTNSTAQALIGQLGEGDAEQIMQSHPGDALLRYLALLPAGASSAGSGATNETANTAKVADEADDVTDSNVFEMLWDCQFCGTDGLLGVTHRFCPNCGSPQDPSWRYFPSDDEKVAVKDHRFVGEDVLCPACGNLNTGDAEFCTRCGSPLTEAAKAKRQASQERAEGEKFQREDLQARLHAESDAAVGRVSAQAAQPEKKRGGNRLWLFGILGVIALLVAGAAFVFTRSEEITVLVVDHQWERTIEVEEYRRTSGNSSCGSEPAGAYNIDRRYEQVDTRRVPDGEECQTVRVDQGDGTFREEQRCETTYRNEPVFGYVCYYDLNRWQTDGYVEAEGGLDDSPYWPVDEIDICNTQRLGCEREGSRSEEYLLVLRNTQSGDEYSCDVPQQQWRSTRIEAAFTLEINPMLNNARCDTLTPN